MLERYNFDDQLSYLHDLVIQLLTEDPSVERSQVERMLLSITQSVKTAREHELNCRDAP